MNCSSASSYDEHMASLRTDLKSRGYPEFSHIPYDANKRYALLEKMRARNNLVQSRVSRNDTILVFKAQYGVHLKALQIKRECNKLYAMLRQNIGHTFLESVRTVIAHPVRNNESLRSIVYNFVPGTTGSKLQGKSGG